MLSDFGFNIVLRASFSVLLALRLPRMWGVGGAAVGRSGGGGGEAGLGAFRMFDRFVRVWICRFPLPLDVWEGLRFVTIALPGLFSYFFFLSSFRRNNVD